MATGSAEGREVVVEERTVLAARHGGTERDTRDLGYASVAATV